MPIKKGQGAIILNASGKIWGLGFIGLGAKSLGLIELGGHRIKNFLYTSAKTSS